MAKKKRNKKKHTPKKPPEEVIVSCAVCTKGIPVIESEIPTTAKKMIVFLDRKQIPYVIDWDHDGQIVTFCSGDHLKLALTEDGKQLRNPIPRIPYDPF